MPDREKVIGSLETAVKNFERYSGDEYGREYDYAMVGVDVLEDALALLKAQDAIKPTRYQEGRWFKTWRCGACGGTLVFRNGEDKPNYCTDCGRAVKWK